MKKHVFIISLIALTFSTDTHAKIPTADTFTKLEDVREEIPEQKQEPAAETPAKTTVTESSDKTEAPNKTPEQKQGPAAETPAKTTAPESSDKTEAPNKTPEQKQGPAKRLPEKANPQKLTDKTPDYSGIIQPNDGKLLVLLEIARYDTRRTQDVIEDLHKVDKEAKSERKTLEYERKKSSAGKNTKQTEREVVLKETIEIISKIESNIEKLNRLKNECCALLGEKINFDHPFLGSKLLSFFYMLAYTDTDFLRERAKLIKQNASKNKSPVLEKLAVALDKFCDEFERLIRNLEEFLKKCPIDILRKIDEGMAQELEILTGKQKTESRKDESKTESRADKKTSDKSSSDKSKIGEKITREIKDILYNLPNLKAAYMRYAATEPQKKLSGIDDINTLMRSMLTNLQSIKEKTPAIEGAEKIIKEYQDEFSEASVSKKILILSDIVSAYNDAISKVKEFDEIADKDILKFEKIIFISLFDEFIEQLNRVKKDGKLSRSYVTAVEKAIADIKEKLQQFKSSSNISKREQALTDAIKIFNETITLLKDRKAPDTNWTELTDSLTVISDKARGDTLSAFQTFAKAEEKSAKAKEETSLPRSSALKDRTKSESSATPRDKGVSSNSR